MRLRGPAWRSAGFLLLWLALLAGAVVTMVAAYAAADTLLHTGTHVTGRVLGERPVHRGYEIDIAYPVGGRQRTGELDTRYVYRPGTAVEVTYDPADPGRFRTANDPNPDGLAVAGSIVGGIAALLGFGWSLVTVRRWRVRYLAVRASGWRWARVVVHSERYRLPRIAVRYKGGERVDARALLSLHSLTRPVRGSEQEAWVGGAGAHWIVLFPGGPKRNRPYVVPVGRPYRRPRK